MLSTPPVTVRRAGIVVAVEGAAGLVVAVVLVVLGFGGGDQKLAWGTAACFALIGAGVLAAGWALWTGRRWGRGIAVFAQLLLLPVAWYMAVGSHRPELGVPVAVIAAVALVLLFTPSSVQWWRGDDQRSASPDSAGPETR
jgi:peptidoglycan/LPS O-acetylase OafA/YrhL